MLKIFMHIATIGDWQKVVARLVGVIDKYGLYQIADEINVGIVGDNVTPIFPEKYKIVTRGKLTDFEFPTLKYLKENTTEEDTVLYIHTKGVSKCGTMQREGVRRWCDYLTWGCIEKHKDMLRALNSGDYDIASLQWTNLNDKYANLCGAKSVFAGNFWWATGKYIKSLPEIQISENRWLAEGWVVGNSPRYFDYHNTTKQCLVTGSNGPNAPTFRRKSYEAVQCTVQSSVVIEPIAIVEQPIEPTAYSKPNIKFDPPRARHEVINALINTYGYNRYLEIGVLKFDCFKNVKCKLKECVDPVSAATYKMTSDAFFAKYPDKKYDIYFIDGLHTEEQVYKDIINALAQLNDGGSIVCHDMMPETEWEQRSLPDGYDGKGVWTGDVWRAWVKLRMTRPDLKMCVLDLDFGTAVIRKGSQQVYVAPAPITYGLYVKDKKRMLNLIKREEFCSWL